MASAKEIKNHIGSVKNTQKITNAMYLIASTKLRRARESLARTQPYFDALRTEIARAFQCADRVNSPYVATNREAREDDVYGCLALTTDHGLAGAYNQNVAVAAEQLIEGHENTRLFVVGSWGRQHFLMRGLAVDEDFSYLSHSPDLSRAREIATHLLDLYERGEIKKLYVVYTELRGMVQRVITEELLPIEPERFADGTQHKEFRFEPSADAVIASTVPGYVTGYLYSAMVESYCAEQSARASAMDAASDNAQELLDELTKEYNHERQGAITQEIIEVSAGARAKKQKEGGARK